MPLCGVSPVLEGVVHDGFQHQAVANVRRATEMEHVYAPEGRVSVAQAAGLSQGNTTQTRRGVCDCFGAAGC